jgi:uncharacterized protein (TIGR02996 family)
VGFRYFELVDEAAERFLFWEIALEAGALQMRHGLVGTAGKYEAEMCASIEAAAIEYERRVVGKLEEGYRECADRRLDVRTKALEQAIEADLDDVDAFLVYADWIQTLGDPRGGLIVAQAGGDRSAAQAYLADRAALFLGPLAEHTGYDGALLDLAWHCGFIRRAKLTARNLWQAAPEKVFEQLLEHSSTRWLTELAIDVSDRQGGNNDTWAIQPVVDVLCTHYLPYVRTLAIGSIGHVRLTDEDNYIYPNEPTWHAALGFVWRSTPAVRRLVLRGDPGPIGAIALPALERLELEPTTLTGDAIAALTIADVPRLERLDVRFREVPYLPAATRAIEQRERVERLDRLFASSLGRRLDHLAITGVDRGDDLCRLIATMRRPALRALDLPGNSITGAGAEALAGSELALDVLDVSGNRIPPAALARLERIAKLVVGERQVP